MGLTPQYYSPVVLPSHSLSNEYTCTFYNLSITSFDENGEEDEIMRRLSIYTALRVIPDCE